MINLITVLIVAAVIITVAAAAFIWLICWLMPEIIEDFEGTEWHEPQRINLKEFEEIEFHDAEHSPRAKYYIKYKTAKTEGR